jgi:hypothetical protein
MTQTEAIREPLDGSRGRPAARPGDADALVCLVVLGALVRVADTVGDLALADHLVRALSRAAELAAEAPGVARAAATP